VTELFGRASYLAGWLVAVGCSLVGVHVTLVRDALSLVTLGTGPVFQVQGPIVLVGVALSGSGPVPSGVGTLLSVSRTLKSGLGAPL
jgi:hypothetical protein